MPSFNEDLFDAYTEQSVDLLRVTEAVRADVIAFLLTLRDDIVRKITDAQILEVIRARDQIRRMENLLKEVKVTIKTAYKESAKELKSQLLELSDIVNEQAVFIPNDLLKADIFSTALTRKDLEVLASDTLIQGSPAAEWWAKQEADTVLRFSQQVRMGVANGEPLDKIVQRIRGTATGRSHVVTVNGEKKVIRQYVGGVLDVSTKQAEALIRTAVQAVSNEVLFETYKGNEDVLRGVALQVTLDNRTSEICRLRSGGAWDFKGDPLPESAVKIKFPGRPPYHFRCRSVLYPIVKSFSELTGIPGLVDIKAKTQSSMDGQVPASYTYEAWLKTKPVNFQKQVLGEAKWNLWSKDKLGFSEMIDQSGNPLTMSQLRAKINRRP